MLRSDIVWVGVVGCMLIGAILIVLMGENESHRRHNECYEKGGMIVASGECIKVDRIPLNGSK